MDQSQNQTVPQPPVVIAMSQDEARTVLRLLDLDDSAQAISYRLHNKLVNANQPQPGPRSHVCIYCPHCCTTNGVYNPYAGRS